MANPFPKPISKTPIKTLIDAEWEDLNKLTAKESRSLERRLRKVAEKRLETIEKHGSYSPAASAYLPNGLPKLSKPSDSRQLSMHNIAQLKTFLGAQSSTLTGIRKITKETEKRIFGADNKGSPLYHFASPEDEKRFWKAYDEFLHQNPLFGLESTRVQQFLGSLDFWKYRDYDASDFTALLDKLNSGDKTPFQRILAGSEGWGEFKWGS